MPVRIVVDERERNSRIPDLLRQAGAIIDFAQLKVGDYIVSPETAIERKTIRDLINSIYDGRLFVQCSELAQHYSKPIVIIEGNILDLLDVPPPEIDDDQLRILIERVPLTYNALAAVALDFRIPTIHTPSAEYTSQLLVTIVNKSLQEGRSNGPLLKRIKKGNLIYTQQLSILSSLPRYRRQTCSKNASEISDTQECTKCICCRTCKDPWFWDCTCRKNTKNSGLPP